MKKPVIAIPIGDPAGVGPEIVAKSIASDEVFQIAVCVIVGDRKILEKAIEITGENLKINEIKEPDEAVDEKGVLNLIDLDNVDMDTFAYGKVSGMCGKAAYEYIAKSIELANAGQVDAVATTPINKESLHAAEVPYIGHTEIFGALTHTEDPLTMFETNGMRVFFLTRHVSLRQMLDMIKKDRIIDYVKRCTKALERLGVKEGTMAIAGLNPHSGEHGLFGWEEVEEIMPAIEELKAEGYDVAGRSGRIRYSIRLHRANIPVYYRSIMIRDILRQRRWTLKKRLRSQMVCRSFGHLWITEPHSILREKEL